MLHYSAMHAALRRVTTSLSLRDPDGHEVELYITKPR